MANNRINVIVEILGLLSNFFIFGGIGQLGPEGMRPRNQLQVFGGGSAHNFFGQFAVAAIETTPRGLRQSAIVERYLGYGRENRILAMDFTARRQVFFSGVKGIPGKPPEGYRAGR